jgi:hypothetical protein
MMLNLTDDTNVYTKCKSIGRLDYRRDLPLAPVACQSFVKHNRLCSGLPTAIWPGWEHCRHHLPYRPNRANLQHLGTWYPCHIVTTASVRNGLYSTGCRPIGVLPLPLQSVGTLCAAAELLTRSANGIVPPDPYTFPCRGCGASVHVVHASYSTCGLSSRYQPPWYLHRLSAFAAKRRYAPAAVQLACYLRSPFRMWAVPV